MKFRMDKRMLEAGGLLVTLLLPLCFNPWAPLPFEPVKVTFFRWTVAGMVASTLLFTIRNRQGRLHRISQLFQARSIWRQADHWLTLLVLVYGGVYLLATVVSINPRQSLWGLSDKHGAATTWSCILFFLLITGALRTRAQVERISRALLLGSVPVSLYGIVQFLSLDPLVWITDSVSPMLSTLGRSNFLGAYLAVVIPFTLSKLPASGTFRGDRPSIWFGTVEPGVAVVLLLQIACLLLTQARAAWLALVGGVAAFFWGAALRRWRGQALLGLCLFWVISAASLFFLNQFTWSSPAEPVLAASGATFSERRAASVLRRLVIWRSTLPLLREHWLLGYGPETFLTVFARHYPPGSLYDGSDVLIDDPHNLLLEHLMAVGLLGSVTLLAVITLFYAMIVLRLRHGREQSSKTLAAACLGAMTAFLIQAQFNPDVIVLSVLFWLVLALGAVMHRMVLSV